MPKREESDAEVQARQRKALEEDREVLAESAKVAKKKAAEAELKQSPNEEE